MSRTHGVQHVLNLYIDTLHGARPLLRSQVLASVYELVQRREIDERAGRKILDDIRKLRIRLLGDHVLQDRAWRIAAALNWPDTYRTEYIALTQLQADA